MTRSQVFFCSLFDDSERTPCPGGDMLDPKCFAAVDGEDAATPGGVDTRSYACGKCLPGYAPAPLAKVAQGVCNQCQPMFDGGSAHIAFLVMFLILGAVKLVYSARRDGRRKPRKKYVKAIFSLVLITIQSLQVKSRRDLVSWSIV